MKKLILILMVLSTHAWSDVQEVNELSDSELSKKLIASAKEFEIKETLSQSAQFKECKDKAQFKPGMSQADKNKAADDAVKCFQQKIGTGKSSEELGKLSDALGLQTYGLVNSKTTKDITAYLADQMYEKLTGVNPNEQNAQKKLQDMKFGKKKLIDQKIFIQLYKTQLIKNSLFEVSRFCFENFRYLPYVGNPDKESSFIKHWEGIDLANVDIKDVTDTGSKGLGSFSNPTSTQDVYKEIFTGLGAGSNNFAIVEKFFESCSTKIAPLCGEFKKTVSQSGKDQNNSSTLDGTNLGGNARGANACLTKDRIQKLRKAIADSKKVADEFDRMDAGTFQLKIANLNLYNLNQESGDLSADNLTNYASADLLKAQVVDDKTEKKLEECKDGKSANCDDFLIVDDSRQKLENDVDIEYRLKREVELARVKKLKEEGDQKLKEYLTDNGYLDLAERLEKGEQIDWDQEMGNIYDAKRLAALNEIKNKLGKRQMSESEATATAKEAAIKENVQATQEEKARLAQLVLFNNVITGYLTLKKTTGEELGRNVNALKKETQGLTAAQVDPTLFQNLKTKEGEGGAKESLFENASFLDSILGATK